MAIIDLNKKRKTTGSYERLTGNDQISNVVRSTHAASISSGTQVSDRLTYAYVGNLATYKGKSVNTPTKTLMVLKQHPEGVIIFGGFIPKKNGKKQEIDLIVLLDGVLYCFEIKEGNALDTKKSEIEIDGIERSVEYFTSEKYKTNGLLLLIHMNDGIHSIKDIRAKKYVMSGSEFCTKFLFDFQKYNQYQEYEAQINEKIIVDEMRQIVMKYDRLHNQ